MDQVDDPIASQNPSLAGREIPTNYGRNNNSPATGQNGSPNGDKGKIVAIPAWDEPVVLFPDIAEREGSAIKVRYRNSEDALGEKDTFSVHAERGIMPSSGG
jgi:hypothetical protein